MSGEADRRLKGPIFAGTKTRLNQNAPHGIVQLCWFPSRTGVFPLQNSATAAPSVRGGVIPRRLAWSLALGVVIGINPSIGLATLTVAMLAWAFGLNQVASQIGVQAVTPLHLLLFVPFIELGVCTDSVGPCCRNRDATARLVVRRALVLLIRRHKTLLRSRPVVH